MEPDSPVKPHIIFYNLTSSGASAIVPILNEILADDYGYEIMDGPHKSAEFSKKYEPNRPQFHWTHSPAACFEQYLQRDDFRFVCLYRDPRDVLISHVKDAKNSGLFADESEEETYLNYIRTDFNSMFHEADEWLNLNQGNVLTLSFEEMKADIPNTQIPLGACDPVGHRVVDHRHFHLPQGRI